MNIMQLTRFVDPMSLMHQIGFSAQFGDEWVVLLHFGYLTCVLCWLSIFCVDSMLSSMRFICSSSSSIASLRESRSLRFLLNSFLFWFVTTVCTIESHIPLCFSNERVAHVALLLKKQFANHLISPFCGTESSSDWDLGLVWLSLQVEICSATARSLLLSDSVLNRFQDSASPAWKQVIWRRCSSTAPSLTLGANGIRDLSRFSFLDW